MPLNEDDWGNIVNTFISVLPEDISVGDIVEIMAFMNASMAKWASSSTAITDDMREKERDQIFDLICAMSLVAHKTMKKREKDGVLG